jgi:hypothetical protein
MRPLWQILITVKDQSVALDCDECFQFMEHLADEAIAGADQASLREAVKDHLANCPECSEHHQKKLATIENKFTSQRGTQGYSRNK